MSKPLILITGATGKTGAPVVEQLLERGYPVRACFYSSPKVFYNTTSINFDEGENASN